MSSSAVDGSGAPGARRWSGVGRVCAWLMAPVLGLAMFWLAPAVAQAGTITVVDGPNTPPTGDGVVNDGFIEAQLAVSSFNITTTSVITGPDEIRVLQGVTITWTAGTTLTLDAGSSIVVTGTIQHDGPSSGEGGLDLLVSGAPTGTVMVGAGDQATGVAAGSRHGLTRVQAGGLLLNGGGVAGAFAQLGFNAVDQGAGYAVTGPISVTVSQEVNAVAGSATNTAVQIGHGGIATGPSGNFSGPIAVEARSVNFRAGSSAYAFAQLGNGGAGADGNHSGDHRIDAGDDVNFIGGIGGAFTYAQFGNGGLNADGNHSGSHTLNAGGAVQFLAGDTTNGYVQMGNGGNLALGSHSGSHTLTATDGVTFQAGIGTEAYAQFGNGGDAAIGSHSGSHRLSSGGSVFFQGGTDFAAYAQFGNGGYLAVGGQSGSHSLEAEEVVGFAAGSTTFAYAQYGNGGREALGNHSGGHSLTAGDLVFFQGGGDQAYAQFGNGGDSANGNHSGDHRLDGAATVSFVGGEALGAYAQYGNGGIGADGNFSGGHSLDTEADVTFQGGPGFAAYAQFGNGGDSADGQISGNQRLNAGGDVSFLGGSGEAAAAQFGNGGEVGVTTLSGSLALTTTGNLTMTHGVTDAYAMIGHGSDVTPTFQSTGSRAGEIRVRVGNTAVFSGSQVGHLTASGVLSVTTGNTLLGVSQNNPFASGTGQLLVTGPISSNFSSASFPNGELRVYLPREDSQQIPTSASFNGENFATANTIPPAQLAGFALFGQGTYISNFSFYLGPTGAADLAIAKTATPDFLLIPGQVLTYTISFSNTGTVSATGVALSDPLPGLVGSAVATLLPDAGVTITQTSGGPNFAWTVSDLGAGKGGRIRLVAAVNNSAAALGQTFTNTATISATNDITLTNNTASVASSVAAGATLTVTKTVVGDPPGSAWQFTGSGSIGSFSLPAIGGSKVITNLFPTAYTISEVTQAGYTAAVSCTNGASGTNSVQVTLSAGSAVACVFTNTAGGSGSSVRLHLPAVNVVP